MELEAIYEDGRLKFTRRVKLRRSPVKVVVDVPDSEVLSLDSDQEEELDEYARELMAGLDAIRNAPLPPDSELPPLTEKQIERFEAFKMREDR